MAAPIINVLIKSDRIHRKAPHVGQTVRMAGRSGLFLVMRSDQDHRVADLMDRMGVHRMEENVPYAQLKTVSETVSEAVHQFLQSARGDGESRIEG